MGRRVLFLCLWLALGAISTVAVAWGFEMRSEFRFTEARGFEAIADGGRWDFVLDERDCSLFVFSWRESPHAALPAPFAQDVDKSCARTASVWGIPSTRIPTFTGLHEALDEFKSGDLTDEIRLVRAHGWPMLALWSHYYNAATSTPSSWMRQFNQGWPISNTWWRTPNRAIVLPLRPLWSGFALDTAFYAAAWWVGLSAPFALRRLIRRKRGLCGACGYDLRHSHHAACPECGTPCPLSPRERAGVRVPES